MVIDNGFVFSNFKSGAKVESVGVGADSRLSNLKNGDIVDARVINDLGDGKYSVEVIENKGEGKNYKLNLKSNTSLAVGSEVKMEVKSSGEQPVFDIISTDNKTSALGSISININDKGNTEIVVPVDSIPENINLQQLKIKEMLLIQSATGGRVLIKLPDSSFFYSDNNSINQNLLNLLQKSTFENGIDLNINNASIRQKVVIASQISIQTPQGVVNKEVHLGGEIVIQPGSQEHISRKLLVANERVNASVSNSSLGKMSVVANGSEYDINVSGKIKLPTNSEIVLIPNPAVMTIEGKIQTKLPNVLKYSGLATNSPAQVALDKMITEVGLSPNTQTRQAVTSLLAEHAQPTRENIQLTISVATIAQNQGSNASSQVATNAMMKAASHQIAHNFPLIPSLTKGLSQILLRGEGLNAELNNTVELIKNTTILISDTTQATDISKNTTSSLQATFESLNNSIGQLEKISVPLGEYNTPDLLASFTGSLAGSELALVSSTLEQGIATYLSGNPTLNLFDSIVSILTSELGSEQNSFSATVLSNTEREVLSLLRSLPEGKDNTLAIKDLVGRLTPEGKHNVLHEIKQLERLVIEEDTVINRIVQAHRAVDSIIEKAAAYKAENIVGHHKEPTVFIAEIPFHLGEDSGDGKLKFYGRKNNQSKNKNWNHRVVLDLIMSNLGPVLGDMRFSEDRLNITIGIADENSENVISEKIPELSSILQGKGFDVTVSVKVLEPESSEQGSHSPITIKTTLNKNDDKTIHHLDLEV